MKAIKVTLIITIMLAPMLAIYAYKSYGLMSIGMPFVVILSLALSMFEGFKDYIDIVSIILTVPVLVSGFVIYRQSAKALHVVLIVIYLWLNYFLTIVICAGKGI